MSGSVAQDQLRAYFERVERLDEELKAINDDKKEIFAEAKGNGFDVKAMKVVLQKRRMDPSDRMELEAVVDLYMAAMGMAVAPHDEDDFETGTVIATRAPARPIPAHDADGVILEDDEHEPQLQTAQTEAEQSEPVNSDAVPEPVESTATPSLGDGDTAIRTGSAVDGDVNGAKTQDAGVTAGETAPYPVANVGEGANGTTAVASDDPASREDDADQPRHLSSSGLTGAGEAVSADLPTNSEPIEGAPADKSVEASASAAPSNITPIRKAPQISDPAHPDCRKPSFCGGFSNLGLCPECKAAAAHGEAATA